MLFMRSEFSRKTLATLKLLTTWSTSFMVMDGAFSLSCRPLNLPASAISFSFVLIQIRRRSAKFQRRGQGFGYVPLLFTSRERKNPRRVQEVRGSKTQLKHHLVILRTSSIFLLSDCSIYPSTRS